ncbi:MAG: hypothetical protein H6667_16335 [Ardenticatenaceae bacterium]|nr:hypothetical protein [Ardenticatenaceae bacterium]
MSPKLISIVVLLLLVVGLAVITPAVAAPETPVLSGVETAVATTTTVQQTDALTTTQSAPQPQENGSSSSSLPEGLSRIFASLGLYIVTMFTMAIGTEIVVDVFKLAMGFKSKPTAQKTLEEYEKVLPGTLETLGLGAEAKANLEMQWANMKEILAPVFKAEQVIADLKEEKFSAALEIALGDADPSDKLIATAAGIIKQQIKSSLDKIQADSALGQAITNVVREKVDDLINKLAAQAINMTPEAFYQQCMILLNGELATAVTSWTQTQISELQEVSYETAHNIIYVQLIPMIHNSGFSQETEAKITRQLENFLQNIQTSRHADVYLETLNKLLREVERQRDELASHWRRWIWGIVNRLRQLSWLSWLPNRENRKLDPTIQHPGEAAGKLLEIERRDKQEADSRAQQLRLTSVVVGIVLAYLLQIDSADLLRDLFPQNASFLSMVLVPQNAAFFAWLGTKLHITMYDLSAGVVLTGLAASAGSGFWHDQLSRLQTVKQSTEAAYAAVQTIQQQTK